MNTQNHSQIVRLDVDVRGPSNITQSGSELFIGATVTLPNILIGNVHGFVDNTQTSSGIRAPMVGSPTIRNVQLIDNAQNISESAIGSTVPLPNIEPGDIHELVDNV